MQESERHTRSVSRSLSRAHVISDVQTRDPAPVLVLDSDAGGVDDPVPLTADHHDQVIPLGVVKDPVVGGVEALAIHTLVTLGALRSEERRVGRECGSTWRFRGWPYN